ncbi:dehydrogenase [Streptomyces laurentii]|uniref:Dehydrogenase n=1 Tax=Streptomyces laurentii TaxID=39478 RepID=A0A160NXK7_STRLU|nr:dehydrogenase [Streptomyces laurentii]
MTSDSPICPECDQPLEPRGLLLMGREEDAKRTCRAMWRCPARHVWWHWADRSDEPLEVFPYPDLAK